jgi:hypothetical protein
MRQRSTAFRPAPRLSLTIPSAIPLPAPPPFIREGHIPHYLRCSESVPRSDVLPQEPTFSYVRIGNPSVTTVIPSVRIPPRCRSRGMVRPILQSAHMLTAPCRLPQDSIPFSFSYFGESGDMMGCFTQLVPLPLHRRSSQANSALRQEDKQSPTEIPKLRQLSGPLVSSPRGLRRW